MSKTNGNGNGSAIVRSPKERLEAVKKQLDLAKPQLQALLPDHVSMDRFLRIVTSAISRTPKLLACSPRSIVLSTAQACALGLEPNTPLGLGYLVPFKSECTFIPGYRGMIRLAIQSGEVKSIEARAVFENDECEVIYGTEASISHKPAMKRDRGKLVGVYAVARLENGSVVFDFMSIEEVERIRERSKSKDDGPWVTDYVQMALKTVIRRLCKMLPLSEQRLVGALNAQAKAEAGEAVSIDDIIDVVGEDVSFDDESADEETKTRTEAMKDRLAAGDA